MDPGTALEDLPYLAELLYNLYYTLFPVVQPSSAEKVDDSLSCDAVHPDALYSCIFKPLNIYQNYKLSSRKPRSETEPCKIVSEKYCFNLLTADKDEEALE